MLVSVVTPTYNNADTIKRAIDSVLDQTYCDIEHIIIDDGSSDDTHDVINEYHDDQLRFLEFSENRGANAARNEGIRAAEGDLVSFLDADDVLHTEYIARVVKEFLAHDRSCAGVATSYTWIGTDSAELINYTPNRCLDKDVFIHENPIGSFSATTFRKDIFEEVGYLDENLEAAQDYDFYLRVVSAGFVIYGLSDNLVTKFDRKSNISSDIDRKRRAFNQLVAKHGNLLSSKRLATHHNMLGLISAETGELDTAIHEFRSAIKNDPYNALYYYHFLAANTNQEIYDSAINLKRVINTFIYNIRT